MKILIVSPNRYSLTSSIKNTYESLGHQVTTADYLNALPRWMHQVDSVAKKLPNCIRSHANNKYYELINRYYRKLISDTRPNLLMIYNNQFIDPSLLEQVHKTSRIAFFLGDHPLYSLSYKYNLAILKQSDCTVCPDTHWINELDMMGMPNLIHGQMEASERIFHPVRSIPPKIRETYQTDLIYIGTCYPMASGYKRALFLDSIGIDSIKVFGPSNWNKWLGMFPNLKAHFFQLKNRISDQELNYALNCSKIYPIDQNQGVINGIHFRVFEAISAGILPVVEWRKDISLVFKDLLPVIKSYKDSHDIILHYLNDEDLRKATIRALREHVHKYYSSEMFCANILKKTKLI